jgi:hypothetical protein
MFKRMIGLVGCAMGKHYRSKRRARLEGTTFFSVCEHCGVRLRQRGNKDWIVEKL